MFYYGIKDKCCKNNNIVPTTDGYAQCKTCKRTFTILEHEPKVNPKDFFNGWSEIIKNLKFHK